MQTDEKLEDAPQAPEDVATAPAAPEEWASSDDLEIESFKVKKLPVLGKLVRVRYLTNSEAAQVGLLPTLQGFMEVAEKYAGRSLADLTRAQSREYALEHALFVAEVAHRCVTRPDADADRDLPCEDCNQRMGRDDIRHPASLWTFAQASKLGSEDLEAIRRIAEREEALEEAVGPLSEGPVPSASSPPASIGDETPPTSSA